MLNDENYDIQTKKAYSKNNEITNNYSNLVIFIIIMAIYIAVDIIFIKISVRDPGIVPKRVNTIFLMVYSF
jgi:hypothetical protein